MRRALFAGCLLVALSAAQAAEQSVTPSDPESLPGAAVYKRVCQQCHEGQVPRAPHKSILVFLSGTSIVAALERGLMVAQGATLSAQERRQVAEYLTAGRQIAEYLTGAPPDDPRAAQAVPMCEGAASRFDRSSRPLHSGWGYDNSRFVSTQAAGLDAAKISRLQLKWAFEFPGATRGRSQPSIAYGAVYVGSQDGTVYALDLKSGCVRWKFAAGAEIRTAVVPMEAPRNAAAPKSPRVFFGDVIGRMYSLDAFTGKLAWSTKLDAHPSVTLTGTATLHDGTLFAPVSSLEEVAAADPTYECCTFRGSVVALDAWTGKQKWKSYTITAELKSTATTLRGTRFFGPSGATVFNSPTIDVKRGVLYVGSGDNYSTPADERSDAVVAFRLSDGKVMWHRQLVARDAWNAACMLEGKANCPHEDGQDLDIGASILLVPRPGGGDLLIAGPKNGVAYALDPDRPDALVWHTRLGRGGVQGGIHFGMAASRERIYVPISDMTFPPDRPPPEPARPGLFALDPASGRILWSALADDRCAGRNGCDPGISAAITAIPGAIFAGHLDGRFRAYDDRTGQVLFEYDTRQEFRTISGATARGGSFSGAGPTVRDGYLVINSGYGFAFHVPGNVLLAFAVP